MEHLVVLVIVIILIQAVIWFGLFIWIKRRLETIRRRMYDNYRGRGFIIQPTSALYRGAGARFGVVKGNGVICLTEDALVFEKATGEQMVLSRADIAEARIAHTFKGKPSFASGGNHLVLRMKDGNEIGFLVKDAAIWVDKITGP